VVQGTCFLNHDHRVDTDEMTRCLPTREDENPTRDLYIGKYSPPPGGGCISQCHLGEKYGKEGRNKQNFEESGGKKKGEKEVKRVNERNKGKKASESKFGVWWEEGKTIISGGGGGGGLFLDRSMGP
jgi:hypothetical protein